MKKRIIKWLKKTILKVIKSVSHSALSIIGASAMISEVDWVMVLSVCSMSFIISVLTSLESFSSLELQESDM